VLPDPENMCIAFEVVSLSCDTSVHVTKATNPLLPITFDRFADSIIETVDHKNIAAAHEIVLLVCSEPAMLQYVRVTLPLVTDLRTNIMRRLVGSPHYARHREKHRYSRWTFIA
jgi:hypothetical protein